MKLTARTGTTLGMVVIAAVAFGTPVLAQKKGGGKGSSGGGGSYSCKGDKGVDVPIQVVVDVQSAGRAHLSGYGGSDKSGLIYPTGWSLFDASGRQLGNYPQGLPVWTSSNMLKEANVEGLVPGATYTAALASQDWCGNVGTVRKTFSVPGPSPEANGPELSAPTTIQTGLMGYSFTQINFSVTDDSGLQSVTVTIDGTVVKSVTYGDGTQYRWWLDDYPFDNTQSALEGPNYYIDVPESLKGGLRSVQVTAVDMYGNSSVTNALLSL